MFIQFDSPAQSTSDQKPSFRVWLRPLGRTCKVRVDGAENAIWLYRHLQTQGMACTEPVVCGSSSVFQAVYTDQMPHLRLEAFLGSLPEVQLMVEPA